MMLQEMIDGAINLVYNSRLTQLYPMQLASNETVLSKIPIEQTATGYKVSQGICDIVKDQETADEPLEAVTNDYLYVAEGEDDFSFKKILTKGELTKCSKYLWE